MNNKMVFSTAKAVLLISFAAVTFLFSSATNVFAENKTVQLKATVEKISGTVTVRKAGALLSHDAKIGESLSAGDVIETRQNGRVEIKIENGNIINLKSDSKLVVKNLTKDSSTGDYDNSFEATKGKLRAKVEKLKGNSKFEVKTPTAVGSVRGTRMYLHVLRNITHAFFKNGAGRLLNPKSGFWKNVGDGQNSSSGSNGNVSDPQDTSGEDQKDWESGWETDGAEGYTEPGGEGGDDLGGYTGPNDNSGDAMDDRRNSQDVDLTPFRDNLGSGENGTETAEAELDTDGDGIPDSTDDDDDGDGVLDEDETTQGTDPLKADTDGDGISDKDEPNTDGEGLIDDYDTDDDNDGVLDGDDRFPTDPKRASGNDADGDLWDDEFDPDDNDGPLGDLDGDGVINRDDNFPNDPREWADVDSDGVGDNEDAFNNALFPNGAGNPLSLSVYGSRDSIRDKIIDIINHNTLRGDIQDMIDDTNIRNLDARMEQVTDAQTGKVLTDRQGYRVRIEQYVLRPDSQTVQLLNINLRTQEAGSLSGLNTLDWTTRFNQSLDSLTGQQLRDLPWNEYLLGSPVKYGSTRPSYYPDWTQVRFDNSQGNTFMEKKDFGALKDKGWWIFHNWQQDILWDKVSFDRGDSWHNFRTSNISGGSSNPDGFKINPSGLGSSYNVYIRFYVIDDSGNLVNSGGKAFDSIWEALAVNMPRASNEWPWQDNQRNIGDNNLEIRLSSKFGGSQVRDIDLIYIPWNRQTWHTSHNWEDLR